MIGGRMIGREERGAHEPSIILDVGRGEQRGQWAAYFRITGDRVADSLNHPQHMVACRTENG